MTVSFCNGLKLFTIPIGLVWDIKLCMVAFVLLSR